MDIIICGTVKSPPGIAGKSVMLRAAGSHPPAGLAATPSSQQHHPRQAAAAGMADGEAMAVDGAAAPAPQNEGHTVYVNNLPEKVSQDGEPVGSQRLSGGRSWHPMPSAPPWLTLGLAQHRRRPMSSPATSALTCARLHLPPPGTVAGTRSSPASLFFALCFAPPPRRRPEEGDALHLRPVWQDPGCGVAAHLPPARPGLGGV